MSLRKVQGLDVVGEFQLEATLTCCYCCGAAHSVVMGVLAMLASSSQYVHMYMQFLRSVIRVVVHCLLPACSEVC